MPLEPHWREQLAATRSGPLPGDIEVARLEDTYGAIQIYDRDDKRYLAFDSPNEQSGIYKSDPARLLHQYTQAMMLVMLYAQPRHITLLGLGGGALTHCLYQHYPLAQLQAVELRPAVIDAAYRFFRLPLDPRLRVTQANAGAYLAATADGSTDILFADLYWAYEIDQYQLATEFIAACHRVLNTDGWLVLNYFCEDRDKLAGLKMLYQLFPVIKTCTTRTGNLIVYAGKNKPRQSKVVLMQSAITLGERLHIPLINHKRRLQGGVLHAAYSQE